ncbi:ATP-binding protein [Lentzea flaviverrucosa]|uniref:ATPase family associated with various cellular activities (AAA) n=1 Tax=Lentzea flaviverrucosa TaxID=200379 RepID=A0A1H9CH43_9PSEU|nr:ATP-binding protein [Lentzea flaviverrucosa]RDI24546.1 ATPase family protein associated with various cellular activities (AAA) [Lentzea flaviverrucosa]SEQ00464.1 ATPase family associated with various cellular activities (AAA) [Lentzea flaviverrucosa]
MTGDSGDDFVEVIAREVEADPGNLALREDFITLLLEHDPNRAATELKAFEATGGDPARARVLRARLMAARMRASNPPPPAETAPVPAPADHDRQDGSAAASEKLWDAERPAVTLADVAGLAEVKRHLDTTFLAPLRNPELAAAFGQKPGGSLLMYGPPGCGKTFIARAIAGDLGASFIHVTLADLLSKYVGESEKAIQSVFRNARAAKPCVIFFDEFDALGGRRTSGGGGSQTMRMLVTQLLEELDGVAGANEGVYFLAATNRPWDIDPALRRPGRIDKTVLVLPPDAAAREAIVQGALEGKPADDVDFAAVAAATEGFSGADLSHLTTTVLQQAMVESMSRGELVPVSTGAVLAAVSGVIPSTTSWFDQVAPVLEFGVDDGTFDQLRAYRVRRGMR